MLVLVDLQRLLKEGCDFLFSNCVGRELGYAVLQDYDVMLGQSNEAGGM
jgi:hypothetical protein